MVKETGANRMLRLKTREGLELDVRPSSLHDRNDLLPFLKSITPEDLRFRFLAAVKPSDMLAGILADVDHREREDLIAFDVRDGSIIASAMIAAGQATRSAEIAVLVRSDLKGQGIGWVMLERACSYARTLGYDRAECVEASDNQRAITLESEQGFSAHLHPADAGLTVLTKVLTEPAASPARPSPQSLQPTSIGTVC